MPKKILLITNDQREVDNLAPSLEGLGYVWKNGATASAGIELYEDFQPDLIILNALVPGGGGYEVCQAIRRQHRDDKTKIIVTSAVSSGTIQLEARLKWKADEVVLLPITLKKIVQLIAYSLGDMNRRPSIKPVSDLAVYHEQSKEVEPAKRRIARTGDLQDVPFGRLIALLVKSNASGVLTLGMLENAREVLIDKGRIIELRSAYLNDLGLADILAMFGWVNAEVIKPFVDLALMNGQRLGGILREKGLIDDYQLFTALGEQVTRKLADVFNWRKGFYRFHALDPAPLVEEPLDLQFAKTAFQAARMSTNHTIFEDQYEPWLDSFTTVNDSSPIRMNLLPLSSQEKRFLFQLDGKRKLKSLLKEKMLPDREAKSLINALIKLGLLSRHAS